MKIKMQYQGSDNKIYRALPEGVSVNLIPAGIAVRSIAYLIDFLIRAVVIISCGIVFSYMGNVGEGLLLLLYFIVSWGYYIYFEAKNGQTPGKKKVNLRIVQDNGLPAKLSHIVLRNLLRSADAFPFAYCLGLAVMVSGKESKRIGDWAAGTLVVYDEDPKIKMLTKEYDSKVPNFNLSTEEQQAVIAFSQRSYELSPSRQAELANILSKQLAVSDEEATQKLKEIAQYYAGQKI